MTKHVTAFDVQSALMAFGSSVQRSATYADLGGDFSASDVYRDALKDLGAIIKQAKDLHAELNSLVNHAHEWNDDSYCNVCGADGRA